MYWFFQFFFLSQNKLLKCNTINIWRFCEVFNDVTCICVKGMSQLRMWRGVLKNSCMLVSSVDVFLVCKWKNSFHYLIVYASVVYVEMSVIFKTPEKSKFEVHMSVHRKYISKVQPTRCNVFSIYLFLWVALHVSGGSSAHHQEYKTVHIALGIVKPILLPAAVVDEMELAWMCTWRRMPPSAHSS